MGHSDDDTMVKKENALAESAENFSSGLIYNPLYN